MKYLHSICIHIHIIKQKTEAMIELLLCPKLIHLNYPDMAGKRASVLRKK